MKASPRRTKQSLSVRLDQEVLDRIDALKATLSMDNLSDVLRRVIGSGIARIEKQQRAIKGRKTPARRRRTPKPARKH